jgi:hypothetical protein
MRTHVIHHPIPMLPRLTPLQYLVLHFLFVGPQTGEQLRHMLRTMGVRQSRTAFSRLMMRLIVANYVSPQVCTHRANDQTIRQCRYEITNLAIFDWTEARKFYLNLAPPSPDLVPIRIESGDLAAYDPKLRRAVIDQRFADRLNRSISGIADHILKQGHAF